MLYGTAGVVLAAGTWLPTSLTPPFSPGTWRPVWPEVVAFQPVWRAPVGAAPGPKNFRSVGTDGSVGVSLVSDCVRFDGASTVSIEFDDGTKLEGTAAAGSGFVMHHSALARAGMRFAGIEWSPWMVGGHVHWPLLAVELVAVVDLGALTLLGLRLRACRTAARDLAGVATDQPASAPIVMMPPGAGRFG